MHMDMSQEAGGAEIYRDDAGCLYRGRHLVRARAVEMQTVEIQMDMSQEVFCAEIYREDARR